MRLPWMSAIASFLFSATLSAPAWANANANSAVPGTLNYVEGKVSIGGDTLDSKSIGSAELKPGQSLTTESGKAEVLLTPGVFLRVGDNSTVTMISPGLTDTEIRIERGHAMVEVEEIHPENDIRVTVDGATARILKTGLYDFKSDAGWVRVYDGQALVKDADKEVKVKGGRELDFAANGPLKAQKFDKKADEDSDLYRWSSLRSGYVAEANVDAAGIYAS
ncbi:MAG TPA: FecR domain-containing protein, partial [Candidatus Acidoferrum sp.]|nr:FecR domain-containing protein [Candidatus Acidoferrum sp.]